MISAIFGELGTIISSITEMFTGLFTNVVGIFYQSGASAGLTDVGKLTLVGVAVGLFWLVLRYLRRLIKMRG